MAIGNQKQKDEGFVGVGTKIPTHMADLLNLYFEAKGSDIYHWLQWVCYSFIEAMKGSHAVTPEIRLLLDMMENEYGWTNAFNLCAPNGKTDIAQAVLILQQKDRRGFGLVLVNKPFFADATQTECLDDIFERVCEVAFPGIYRKLRYIASNSHSTSIRDLLLKMIETEMDAIRREQDAAEMRGEDDFVAYGTNRPLQSWSQRYRRARHRTPDSLANSQQTIQFTDEDSELADMEADGWGEDADIEDEEAHDFSLDEDDDDSDDLDDDQLI